MAKMNAEMQKAAVAAAKDLNKVLGLEDPEIDVTLKGDALLTAIKEAVAEITAKEMKVKKVENEDGENLKKSTWDFIAKLDESDDEDESEDSDEDEDESSDDAPEDDEDEGEEDEDADESEDEDEPPAKSKKVLKKMAKDDEDDEDDEDEGEDDESNEEDEDEDEPPAKTKKTVKPSKKDEDEDEDEDEEEPVKKTTKKAEKVTKKAEKVTKKAAPTTKAKADVEVSKWEHRVSCMGGYIDQQLLKGAKRSDILKALAEKWDRKGSKGEAKLDVHVGHLRSDHKVDVRFNEEKGTYRIKQ